MTANGLDEVGLHSTLSSWMATSVVILVTDVLDIGVLWGKNYTVHTILSLYVLVIYTW